MKCAYCHQKILVVDDARTISVFEGEEFLLHEYCASVVQNDERHLHGEAKVSFFKKLLSKLSQ